jgi:hypothetical protein
MDKDLTRAEFLKRNSPLKSEEEVKVTAPPLFEETKNNSILGDVSGISGPELTETKKKKNKNLKFWKDWSEKHYTYASVGLAMLLIVYVGVSVASLSGGSETPLNATLSVDDTTENTEPADSDEVIQEDVVDSTMVIEDIEKDSSEEEPSGDITEYIFENYEF